MRMCAEYAFDIDAALRDNELRTAADPHYMDRQRDITSSMRAILMDWLVEVAEEYNLQNETLYLTFNFVDRFLSKQNVMRTKLQLVGVAAMLIAAKVEEIYPPLVEDFVYITDNSYSRSQVLHMEKVILDTLAFELVATTPLPFLIRYSRSLPGLPAETLSLARYYLELSIQSYLLIRYLPSQMAAAALALALSTRGFAPWSPSLAYYSQYSQADLKACVLDLTRHISTVPHSQLQGIWEKFSHSKWHRVSEGRIWTAGDPIPFQMASASSSSASASSSSTKIPHQGPLSTQQNSSSNTNTNTPISVTGATSLVHPSSHSFTAISASAPSQFR